MGLPSAIATAALLLAPLAVFAALLPAPAHAGETMGQATANTQGVGCGERTYIQARSANGAYAAPYDGVITSWTNLGYSTEMKFKAARLGPGNSFTVIGSDGPHAQANGVRTTNPVRIPVRQGDVIGYHTPGGYCLPGGSTEDALGYISSDPPVGATAYFDTAPISGLRAPVEAYIEPDRDNDGFGDESQDDCPTNAATQGVCPLPTTLGRTFTPSTTLNTVTAIPALPAEYRYTAPADGVVTSWGYQANALVNGTAKLKIFRPLGGDSFGTVAESELQTPIASTLNTFPTRLAVRAGDRIGIRANSLPVHSTSNYDFGSSWVGSSDPAPGIEATFSKGSRYTNVSAVLEADVDGDGYGDTSQDLCPTVATTQGQCPATEPPPAENQACEEARKNLAKAKAKLKKLKRNEAAAKKIKASKAKVMKAKSAVKKAC